ncbi:methyltransferase domain-containing protein [Brevundimonas halotolerans]|jgi:trans-aconitate 2-methyltransferase|uniref:Trans-aconitate 2-methyltransferase n=1 Tax=Brevundimonas halotolerans TaxID=69670 RepID=A0A7W9A466_9CAUL|nr:methyltransferase domain-containing protein [Brevundimonas halotolerans]MBB5660902.1 trans-aconitate 2-methyltransferase [Brevundimonas halotolerans]
MTSAASDPVQWDPDTYARFEAERDRAALDLLVRLPDDLDPGVIWDLGCGDGHHASLLKRRYPRAEVHGLDRSADMLAGAGARDDTVHWHQGDIAAWAPELPVDLIFANAALQWVGDHGALFPALAGQLAPRGVLAVQMPMAFETRHHTLMRQVATEGPWAGALQDVPTIAPLLSAGAYYDRLAGRCDDIDIWSTTYLHALTGEDAVLNWMSGTALRPYLTALAGTPELQAGYLEALGEALSRAFPRRPDGVTLLPFPRLFLLARAR